MATTILNRQRKLHVDTKALTSTADAILTALARDDAELTVTLVSDRRMRALNREFRGIDAPTDVLSFPQSGDDAPPLPEGLPELLGDVVLSVETAARQVGLHTDVPEDLDEAGRVLRELAFLMLHGILHLVGHTHDDPAAEDSMQAQHDEIWRRISPA